MTAPRVRVWVPSAWLTTAQRELSGSGLKLFLDLVRAAYELGSLPGDAERLARCAGWRPGRFKAAWPKAAAFFAPDPDAPDRLTVAWHEQWQSRRRVKAEVGRAGAHTRWLTAAARKLAGLPAEADDPDDLFLVDRADLEKEVAERAPVAEAARVAAEAEAERHRARFGGRARAGARGAAAVAKEEPAREDRATIRRRLESVLAECGYQVLGRREREAFVRVLHRLRGTAAWLGVADPLAAVGKVAPAIVGRLVDRQRAGGLGFLDLLVALVLPGLVRGPDDPAVGGWRQAGELWAWAAGPPS